MGNVHGDNSTGLDDEPEAGRTSPREETAVSDEGEERAGEEKKIKKGQSDLE